MSDFTRNHPAPCPCLECWRTRTDSTAWTGHQPQRFRWWLHGLLWPSYACELCVGQDGEQGCYCAYHGAIAPGGPGAGLVRALGRRVWQWWIGRRPL